MPLSEFYQATLRAKIDATPSKMPNCSSNLSFVPDDEFVELLWENGHVVMQGQSNRPSKTAVENVTLSSLDDRAEGKRSASVTETKMAQLEDRSLFVSNFSPTDPPSNSRTSDQYDDMVPWINYPMEDPSPSDYCSDFFSEFPGVVMPAHGNNNLEHSIKDLPNVEHVIVSKAFRDESDPCTVRTKHSQAYQSSLPSSRPRTEDLGTGGGCNAQSVPGNMLGTRLQKHDLGTAKPQQLGNRTESVNFSHFSKPCATAKVNLQRVDRVRSMKDSTVAATSNDNRIMSTVTESSDAMQSTSRHQGQFSSISMGSGAENSHHLFSTELSQSVDEEGKPRKNLSDDIAGIGELSLRSLDQISHQTSDLAAGISLRALGIERDHEAIVASSSACSDNITGVASDDPKRNAKRKYQGTEPGNHIEDIEDASVGVKGPTVARDMSAKRSRAAEVHNLSERRRRDRINEKMRALQELIPNSSKVDKASMLDEAIEYLKSLQLQVQMMSMGSGLSMPPMVLQNGMQHMRVPPVAHLPQMGMGMTMRFGYGMGMLDMNGSPGYPLIPMPPMHGAHFPRPTVPGPQGLYAMPRPANVPMFGLPTAGNRIPVPHLPPPFNFMPGLSTNSNSTTSTNSIQAPGAPPSSNYKDQKEKRLNSEPSQETDDNDLQGTKESSQQCESNQTSSASETETEN